MHGNLAASARSRSRLGPGGSAAPAIDGILVAVDERCALRCRFCLRADVGRAALDLGTYARALSRCRELGARSVCLTGGEPTDHPQFAELVKVAVQFGYACSVVTAARAGARLQTLAAVAGLISHVTVSADSRGAQRVGATRRTVASTAEVFEALGHQRASLHVTVWQVEDRDISDIDVITTRFDVDLELSPLLLTEHQLRTATLASVRSQYQRDIALLGSRIGLTERFIAAVADLDASLAGTLPRPCTTTRAYLSPRGTLRLCPYDTRHEVDIWQPRTSLNQAVAAMRDAAAPVGPRCALVCREG